MICSEVRDPTNYNNFSQNSPHQKCLPGTAFGAIHVDSGVVSMKLAWSTYPEMARLRIRNITGVVIDLQTEEGVV